MKAYCIRCSLLSRERRSMVMIDWSWTASARVRQDSTRLPSTITVHAPHCPWSQPFFVPVSPMCSRSVEQGGARVDFEKLDCVVDPGRSRPVRRASSLIDARLWPGAARRTHMRLASRVAFGSPAALANTGRAVAPRCFAYERVDRSWTRLLCLSSAMAASAAFSRRSTPAVFR